MFSTLAYTAGLRSAAATRRRAASPFAPWFLRVLRVLRVLRGFVAGAAVATRGASGAMMCPFRVWPSHPSTNCHPPSPAFCGRCSSAPSTLSSDLRSVVLYGSGAERQLRATSDLNLIFVLRTFTRQAIDELREPLRLARGGGRCTDHVPARGRHPRRGRPRSRSSSRISAGGGRSCTATIPSPRSPCPADAMRRQVEQLLLNFELRTRAASVANGLREAAARAHRRTAAPGRCAPRPPPCSNCAGEPAASPKAALDRDRGGAARWPLGSGRSRW